MWIFSWRPPPVHRGSPWGNWRDVTDVTELKTSCAIKIHSNRWQKPYFQMYHEIHHRAMNPTALGYFPQRSEPWWIVELWSQALRYKAQYACIVYKMPVLQTDQGMVPFSMIYVSAAANYPLQAVKLGWVISASMYCPRTTRVINRISLVYPILSPPHSYSLIYGRRRTSCAQFSCSSLYHAYRSTLECVERSWQRLSPLVVELARCNNLFIVSLTDLICSQYRPDRSQLKSWYCRTVWTGRY